MLNYLNIKSPAAGIAKDLKVTVGDELVWDVQGIPLKTTVASLRKVDWRQVRPNFFVVRLISPRDLAWWVPCWRLLSCQRTTR